MTHYYNDTSLKAKMAYHVAIPDADQLKEWRMDYNNIQGSRYERFFLDCQMEALAIITTVPEQQEISYSSSIRMGLED